MFPKKNGKETIDAKKQHVRIISICSVLFFFFSPLSLGLFLLPSRFFQLANMWSHSQMKKYTLSLHTLGNAVCNKNASLTHKEDVWGV